MENKRKGLLILIGSLLVLTIGLTYAYYSASVQGTGNANAEASGRTATLGEVEFNGDTTFDTTNIGRDIYPGFIGVQTFTIAPYKDGHGIYEIDLEANVPSAFGNDIKITLYKTSDVTNNNIDSVEGSLTITNNQYVKQDTLTITGTLEKVYEGSLTTTTETMLEQVEFAISNNAFTTPTVTPDGYYTYFAVYEYINRETSQNSQQGLDFDAKITVKYVVELNNPARDTLEELQALDNTLTVTTSSILNPDFSKAAPQTSAGTTYNGMPVNGDYYITYASDFTYNSETGVYTLTNPITCQWSTCYADTNGKYAVPGSQGVGQSDSTPVTESSSENMNNAMIQIASPTASGADITLYQGDELNNVKTGAWTPQTSGLFELEDDYGTSYFFRGDVTNNYVKFGRWNSDYYVGKRYSDIYGPFTSLVDCENTAGVGNCTKYASDEDEMYWRIIRINGDGSIRMIYDGTHTYDNDEEDFVRSIGEFQYDTHFIDNTYVGYMYGEHDADNYNDAHVNINDSGIKSLLDNWYEINILNTIYEPFLSDEIFCNDRSVANNDTISWANSNLDPFLPYTINAYGTNQAMYAPYGRLIEQNYMGLGNKVTLKCPNKHDAFTVSDTVYGNGALTYPVGLITSDEVNMSGNSYLNVGVNYWTMSAASTNSVITIDSVGYANQHDVTTYNTYVRPVINIKQDTALMLVGNGTALNPFMIDMGTD